MSSSSTRACMNRVRRPSSGAPTGRRIRTGPRRFLLIWPEIPRRPGMSRPSWRGISSADDPPPALVERLATAIPRNRWRPQGGGQDARGAPEAWAPRAEQAQASQRMDGGVSARASCRRVDARHHCRRKTYWASRCGGRRRRRALPTTGGVDRRHRATPRNRQSDRAKSRRRKGSIRKAVLETALGPLRRTETRKTVRAPRAKPQALALLLMAPEFQREMIMSVMPSDPVFAQPAASCCWARACCSPGRSCRGSRGRKAAIRASSPSCLRGALDGLATVAPVGDPDWTRCAETTR